MFVFIKSKALLISLLVVSGVIGYVVFEVVTDAYYQKNGVLLDRNSTPTKHAHQRVEAALQHADQQKIETLLNENPKLVGRLMAKIQSYPLNRKLNNDELAAFLQSVKILGSLVESPYKNRLFESFYDDNGFSQRFTNYIEAMIASYRRLGGGAIARLSNSEIQVVVFETFKLLANLKQTRDIESELHHIAAWYQAEIDSKAPDNVLSSLLLEHAWQLIRPSFQSSHEAPVTEVDDLLIETANDLIRLLNHDDRSVVMKSAKLIGVFSPENATTALRYSLVKNKDNAVRFLILDAMKSYGVQRTQFETLLNKLSRTTNDTAFRDKILETIDHFNGVHVSTGFSS